VCAGNKREEKNQKNGRGTERAEREKVTLEQEVKKEKEKAGGKRASAKWHHAQGETDPRKSETGCREGKGRGNRRPASKKSDQRLASAECEKGLEGAKKKWDGEREKTETRHTRDPET